MRNKDAVQNLVTWQPPQQGWLTLNFDRASKGNLGKSEIGIIIQNEEGQMVKEIVGPIGITSNNVP